METAFGVVGWTPDVFWSSTPYELSCAYIGFCKANGAGRWAKKEDGWSDAEVEEHADLVARWRAEIPETWRPSKEDRARIKRALREGPLGA